MSYIEILNGAVVLQPKQNQAQGQSQLNVLNYEAEQMSLAPQATTLNFEDKLLACKSVPHQLDWLIVVSKTEVALVELLKPQGIAEKASLSHDEIEEEVHQIVVTKKDVDSTTYVNIVILHDQFMLTKFVLNIQTMKFHRAI